MGPVRIQWWQFWAILSTAAGSVVATEVVTRAPAPPPSRAEEILEAVAALEARVRVLENAVDAIPAPADYGPAIEGLRLVLQELPTELPPCPDPEAPPDYGHLFQELLYHHAAIRADLSEAAAACQRDTLRLVVEQAGDRRFILRSLGGQAVRWGVR